VLDGGKLRPEFVKKGVKLSRFVDPEISYTYWLMRDPVFGGLTKEKVALRRAMAMSYNVNEEIRVVRNGQAVEAQYPIPPGVVGHDPNYKSSIRYDPVGANALLDRFGYKKGADGSRRQPDGSPLLVRYASRPDSLGRQQDEMWKKSLDSIGIRMEVQKDKFPELLKLEKECKLQMRTAAWIADYPEYDKLYEQSLRMPDSPARNKLYQEMTKLIEAYAPWRLGISRYRNMLAQSWVLGFKKHPILHAEWQYIDVAVGASSGK
jgi:ABC-type transport system substrate-binding protein